MNKKEARQILGVSKETSTNDIERKFSILLKKHKMLKERPEDETGQDTGSAQDVIAMQDTVDKQEEYSFDQVVQAYNILMGYEVPMKEEPPSKVAPLFRKAGLDEKKTRNIFYYYKYQILAVIIAIISIVSIVRGCVNRVEPDFTTAFIGEIVYTDTDKLSDAIKLNIPEIKEPAFDRAFVTDNDQSDQQYAMLMKATVLFAAGDVDVFILDRANFERYAKQGAFSSLDEIALKLGVDMEENEKCIVRIEDSEELSNDATGDKAANAPVEKHLYGIILLKAQR
jgi:hypothetical protein